MIPGFSNALMPPGHEKESGAKIKRYMCIMDSMTNAELDASDPKMFTVGEAYGGTAHGCCRTLHPAGRSDAVDLSMSREATWLDASLQQNPVNLMSHHLQHCYP